MMFGCPIAKEHKNINSKPEALSIGFTANNLSQRGKLTPGTEYSSPFEVKI